MENIILSIYVATYNHENYIAQALDSILMQKTQYSYEILVGEDCSNDKTREILKKYEKKYPKYFKMYYRDHNMYHDKISNAMDLRLRCKGKYIIALEGDDYWIDDSKIETQITFLEQHPEYIAVAHNCVVVDENSEQNTEIYSECKDEEYTFEHYIKGILPGQLTTVMYRNYQQNSDMDSSIMNIRLVPGDKILYFMLVSYGKIYCMQKQMSAYRHIVSGGSSFSANYQYHFINDENWHKELLSYSYKIGLKKSIYTAEILYIRAIKRGIYHKACTWNEAVKYLNTNVKNVPKTLINMMLRKMKRGK